jgi:hypothetical protein
MNTKTFKKVLTLIGIPALLCGALTAQDAMTFKNGDVFKVKVVEITDYEIKYKNFDNLEGPLRSVDRATVFVINYENGTKTLFNEPVITKTPKTNPSGVQFDNDSSDFATIKAKRFGGPRIGLTYISDGTSADYLSKRGKNPLITQFGWQFEQRIFTVEGGTSGLVEFIPLIGGVEQGLFIPSASLLIGIRGGAKRSFEFAIGPNFAVAPNYKGNAVGQVSLVMAVGTNFKSGNINFPVNIAFIPSVGSKHEVETYQGSNVYENKTFQTGWRLSLSVGFNSRKK